MRSLLLLALAVAPFADAGPASFVADRFANNMMLAKAAPVAPPAKATPLPTRMVLGALGGMGASTFCHPLDVVRVQMQVSGGAGGAAAYKNPLDAAVQIVKREGFFKGLYTGIDAAYLRQWTYGSCRVGIYAFMLDKFGNKKDPKTGKTEPMPFTSKLAFGSVAGAIGSFAGLPSEVSLVRMSADSKMAPELKRNYKSCLDCIVRTTQEEGITKLWSGGVPTVIRATLLSASVLGCYSEAKERLHDKFPKVFPNKEGVPLMFTSTMMASLVATAVSNPFDVVKSRVQNMPKALPGQEAMYKNMADCFVKSVKAEGFPVLYRGFTPAFLKLAPYTTISLILTEKLSKELLGKSAL